MIASFVACSLFANLLTGLDDTGPLPSPTRSHKNGGMQFSTRHVRPRARDTRAGLAATGPGDEVTHGWGSNHRHTPVTASSGQAQLSTAAR